MYDNLGNHFALLRSDDELPLEPVNHVHSTYRVTSKCHSVVFRFEGVYRRVGSLAGTVLRSGRLSGWYSVRTIPHANSYGAVEISTGAGRG